jgi:RNA polymerase sigma-70 factor (ECF subfamily)
MHSLFSYFQDEEKLIDQLANGSDKAFQILYSRYQGKIYKLAMRYLKCEIQAQEVVQDVFMKLWIKRSCLQKERPVEAWLYTVGKNDILNKLKKQANAWKAMNQIKKTQVFIDNSLQEKFQYEDYNKALNSTLNSLSKKQLVVYTLAREENLSYLQIAEQLNISPLTVKTHMSRALCHIRAVLSPILIG